MLYDFCNRRRFSQQCIDTLGVVALEIISTQMFTLAEWREFAANFLYQWTINGVFNNSKAVVFYGL